ncbi:hypothetical protein [Halorhabdus rudnickae]|uniref:hypothetical protein n=1 Tax=Halorhabdus rudnickae TaxID=1775544 RepID=UPI0010840AE6|nr:hypothetical protein [Halorhabdus rudnickae]
MPQTALEDVKDMPIVVSVERHVECSECGEGRKEVTIEEERCPGCGQEVQWTKVKDKVELNTKKACLNVESIDDIASQLIESGKKIRDLKYEEFAVEYTLRSQKPVLERYHR